MLIVRDKVTTLQAAIRNITFLKCQQKVKPLTMENTVGKTCGTMPVSDGSFTIQFRVELSLLRLYCAHCQSMATISSRDRFARPGDFSILFNSVNITSRLFASLASLKRMTDGRHDVLETVAILSTSSPTVFLRETFGKINTFLKA